MTPDAISPALIWFIVGVLLIIFELVTGTFYLLMLGIAALAAAVSGWLGAPIAVQTLVAAIATVAGFFVVRRRRSGAMAPGRNDTLDLGQSVTLTAWLSESQRLARVRYRDSDWDADVLGTEPVAVGGVLFIVKAEGSRLTVSPIRPT
ncbi:MAG: NfeD family protein [Burkholderiales bacterium]|nr:NfeD family protein [Burkholderiales bacterium]